MKRVAETILVCAAIRHRVSGRIIASVEYFDTIMQSQIDRTEGRDCWKNHEKGFLDQHGTFVTAVDAVKTIKKTQQITVNHTRRAHIKPQEIYEANRRAKTKNR